MRKRRLISFGAMLGASLLLTGCSGQPTTTGTPTPISTSQTSAGGPEGGAPAVATPLNPSSLEKAPCDAISQEQLASLGKPQKKAVPDAADALGPKCAWSFDTEHPSLLVGAVFTGDPQHSGISGLYLQQKSGGLTKFEPFTTAGYPGAAYDNSSNALAGDCKLAIGLRDDLTYTILVSLDTRSVFTDPCELGKKVAGFVVEYLKKGQN